MPALGNKGRVSPQSIKAAAKKPAPPIRKLPGIPTTTALRSHAHTGQSVVPPEKPQKGLHIDTSTAAGRKTFREGQKALATLHSQSGIVDPIAKGLLTTTAGTALALGRNPVGTVEHTATGIPKLFSSVAGQFLRTGYEAATGHPLKAAEKFIGQGIESSKGILGQSLEQSAKEGEKEGIQNKVALLTLGTGVAGRGLHAAERAIGSPTSDLAFRKAVHNAASTVRPPVANVDDAGAVRAGQVTERKYSKDASRQALQRVADAKRPKVVDENGQPVLVKQLGQTVPVVKPRAHGSESSSHLLKTRAQFEADRNRKMEVRSRETAQKAAGEVERPGRSPFPAVKGKTAQHLTQLAAEGLIRTPQTMREDLLKLAAKWDHEIANPRAGYRTEGKAKTPGELLTAKANAAMVRKAADDPKILRQAKEIVEQGERYAKAAKPGEHNLAGLQIRPEAQLERRRLQPYAVAHMEAKHFTEKMHRTAEKNALAHETQMAKLAARADGKDAQLNHWASLAQEHRIAVSGKNPELVRAYDQLRAEAKAATQGRKQAERNLAEAQRGRIEGSIPEHQKALQLAQAQEKAARLELQKAKQPKVEEAIRTREGKRLSNEEIEAHMRAVGRNPDTVAYMPHVATTGRKGAFYRPLRPSARPSEGGRPFTGRMLERGSFAINRDIPHENLVSKAGIASTVQQFDKIVHGAARLKPDGTPFTAKQALEAARRMEADTGERMIPVRLFNASLEKEMQKAILERQAPTAMEDLKYRLLNDRLVKPGEAGAKNVGLMPADQFNELLKLITPAGQGEKLLQMARKPFTFTVLAQPKWLVGNFLEPYVLRLPLSGAGVNVPGSALDMAAFHDGITKALKDPRPEIRLAAHEMDVMAGGQLLGKKGRNIRRTYEDFKGSLAQTMWGLHVARNAKLIKPLEDLYVAIPETIFKANYLIERTSQKIALGKAMRDDIHEMTGNWLKTIKVGGQALEDLKKGMTETPRQQRYFKEMQTMLGKYDGWSPVMKKAVQTLFPFLPWVLSSLRFVFWTLPLHHTTAFDALALSAHRVQAEWEAEHKAIIEKAPSLANAIIMPDGGVLNLENYTPFGITTPIVHGEFGGLPGTFNPMLSGPTEALQGRDPFGRPLEGPKSKANPKGQVRGLAKLGVAGNELLESYIWGLAMARRMEEKGKTGYSTSTVFSPQAKPMPATMSALSRTFNPFRETYFKAPKTKGHKASRAKLGPPGASKLGPSGGGGLGPAR